MAHCKWATVAAILCALLLANPAAAVKPAETLLPDTTCLYISFPDMNQFREHFDATQLGKLARDPVMKPFAQDLGTQLRDRFGDTDIQLGLKWEDLQGVYAGEACLARIQPGGEAGQHATAMLLDVTGKDEQLEKVRKKIADNMQQRDASAKKTQLAGVDVTVYQMKRAIGETKAREVYLAIVENQFLLVNHEAEMTDMIQRIKQEGETPLRDAKSFQAVMNAVAAKSKLAPDVRWYLDPFVYADVVRSARRQQKRRGKDLRQILQGQGFDAIRAVGGHLNLAHEDLEVLHRTCVYAPPLDGEPDKYKLAARMLNFPAGQLLPPPAWIPRNLATFRSFNWKIRSAFEHSITLIDDYVGSKDFVEDVLADFEQEGPQINIRKELLDHLGEHVMTFSDYYRPMTTKSERVFVAIEVKDEAKVAAALQKLWQDGKDPTVEKREHQGRVIWEIVPEDEEDLEVTLVPPPGGVVEPEKANPGGPAPNAAMTVANGYLFVATHLDYLKTVLEDRQGFDSLSQSADFQIVNKKLDGLGGGQASFRFFSRKDEQYESAYTMIKQGKMPESESMLGRLLNRFLGPEEEGVLRKQQVDGSKMPDYQVVRRYLGPGGSFVTQEEDGWFVTGVVLNKEKLAAPAEQAATK